MINQDIIAQDLFYKIRGRFPTMEMGDEDGTPTFEATKGRFFNFDAVFEGVNLGKVSINIKEPGRLKIYFNRNILESADDFIGKQWFGFLKEMRKFAMKRIMSLDARDISKENLDKNDFGYLANKGPIMSESAMFGTSRTSYKPLDNTKLIIIHTGPVDDTIPGARSRHIKSLFVQNKEGERFKYPFIHKLGAECMLRHVANGGVPYDDVGNSIVEMSKEIAQLASFKRYVGNHDLMNSDTNHIVGRANERLASLKETMRRMTKQHHYDAYKESFQAPSTDNVIDEVTMEDYKNKFTVKSFQENIADVFPLLHKIMQETSELNLEDVVGEQQVEEELDENYSATPEDQFNEWAEEVVEASLDEASDGPQVQYIGGNQFQVEADGQTFMATATTVRDGNEYDDPVQWMDVALTDSAGQPLDNPVLADEVEEILNNQFGEQAMDYQSDMDVDAGDAAHDAYKDSQYEEGQGMNNELNDIRKMAGLKQQDITDEGKLDGVGKVLSKVGDVAGKAIASFATNPVTRVGTVGAGLAGNAVYQSNKEKDQDNSAKDANNAEEPTKEESGDQTPDEKKAAMEYLQSVARAIKSGQVQPEEVEQEFFNTLPMMGVSDERTMAAWDRITGNTPAPKRSAMSDQDIDAELKGMKNSEEDDDAQFLANLRSKAQSGSIKSDDTGFGAEKEGIEDQVGAPGEDIEQDEKHAVVEKSKNPIKQYVDGFYDAETQLYPLGVQGVLTKALKEFDIEDGSKEARAIEAYIESNNSGSQHGEHDMDRNERDAFEDIRRLSGLPVLAEAKSKKAKRDYDEDGKIETGEEEHAGSIDKAIKKAMNKTEESVELDDILKLSGMKKVVEAKAKCTCEDTESTCAVHSKDDKTKKDMAKPKKK